MPAPKLILEINTRVWIRTLGLGSSPSFREIPDSILNDWQRTGYDAVWLMGVWLPSPKAEEIAKTHPGVREDCMRSLPDLHEEDLTASPYATRGYAVNPEWGGEAALADLRSRMNLRGIRLILDFVPNHIARDHPWIYDHPERFVQGTAELMARQPQNYFRAETCDGPRVIAHGRDPYFDGWSDTAQIDYRKPEVQEAQRSELLRIAAICDGVRCDVAMLILRDVFEKTWGVLLSSSVSDSSSMTEFWPKAITMVKERHPDFCFIAEVYWNLERKLHEQGFDLCYDKTPMDEIVAGKPLTRERFDLLMVEHLGMLRFLENHDEKRIAAQLDIRKLNTAASWLFSLPGSRLIYEGQTEGRRIRIPVQLLREPREEPNLAIRRIYDRIFSVITRETVRNGAWRLLSSRPAWSGSETYTRILGQAYDLGSDHLRIFVNWSDSRSQCRVDPVFSGSLQGKNVVLRDQWTGKVFVRDGLELMMGGLYLDMEPWEAHAFDCEIQDN